MTFADDRAYLEIAVAKLEANSLTGSGKVSEFLRSSFERQFLQLSLHNHHVNAEYVRRKFENTQPSKDVVIRELDSFISVHKSMCDAPSVHGLRHRLSLSANPKPDQQFEAK